MHPGLNLTMAHVMFVETVYWYALGEELGRTDWGLVVELPWGAGICKWGVLHMVCILNLKLSNDLITLQYANF